MRTRWTIVLGVLLTLLSDLIAVNFKEEKGIDLLLNEPITLQEVSQKIKRSADGRIDWRDRGPRNDQEWTFFLNRLGYLKDWINRFGETRDLIWIERSVYVLDSWLQSHQELDSRDPAWRAMEAARRLADLWPLLDRELVSRKDFPAETKKLFEQSIPIHAQCCQFHHASGGNHLLVEMLSLATAAVTWPHFDEAPVWWEIAKKKLDQEILSQTFPDGVQKEFSSMYQIYTLETLARYQALAALYQKPFLKEIADRILQMAVYLEKLTEGDPYGPQNNDSDRLPLRDRLKDLQQRYPFLVSGAPPLRGIFFTSHFKEAGHWIQKAIEGSAGRWVFFDYGPAGIAHQHRDRLNLEVHIDGKPFLINPGRYTYRRDEWRRYFIGSAAHNLLNPAGQNQKWGSVDASMRSIHHNENPLWSSVLAEHRWGYLSEKNSVIVRRGLVSIANGPLIVLDLWVGFTPTSLDTWWHFAPEIKLKLISSRVFQCTGILNRETYLCLAEERNFTRQNSDEFQVKKGWYSESYNQKVVAPVLQFKQITASPQLNVWVIGTKKELLESRFVYTERNGWVSLDVGGSTVVFQIWGDRRCPFSVKETAPCLVFQRESR